MFCDMAGRETKHGYRVVGDWKIHRAVMAEHPSAGGAQRMGIHCMHRDGRSLVIELDSRDKAQLELAFATLTAAQIDQMVTRGSGAAGQMRMPVDLTTDPRLKTN